MDILGVVSRHVSWLQGRQEILAENIANSDTPRYRSKDIAPFALTLQSTAGQLTTTNPKHISTGDPSNSIGAFEVVYSNNSDVSYSGNDVSLEREMKKLGESSLAFSFDTSVMRLFHQMTLMSLKG
jgi:flagellar basal-body rod protein FlgB